MNLELVIATIAGLGTSVLGLFTYYKNPKSVTNRLLFIFSLVLTLYSLVNYLSTHSQSEIFVFFLVKLVMSLALIINLVFFLLVTTYPQDRIQLTRRKLYFCVLSTLFLIILTQSNLVFSAVRVLATGTSPQPGIAMPLFLLHTLGFLGAGFFSLIKKYKKAYGAERQQLKFLLLGSLVMFIAIIIGNLLMVILLDQSWFVQFLPLYIFFFIGFVSYAIIKHRFLDIGLVVARTVSYSFLLLIIATIYSAILLGAVALIPGEYQVAISTLLALFIAFTFPALKSLIEKITNNIFYKQTYDPAYLLEKLANIQRSTLDMDRLMIKTLEALHRAMHVSKAVFVVLNQEKPYAKHAVGVDGAMKIDLNDILKLSDRAGTKPLLYEDIKMGFVKQFMQQNQFRVIIPLTVKSNRHGVLLLGEKSSGNIYNQQDVSILEVLTPQIAVAVQNTLSYDQIQKFNATLRDEVKKATAKLSSANKNLRHLDKLKDEFVYIATHELKNPVTAMRGYLSLINEGLYGDVPKKLKDPLTQLNASNQQLVTLVNDLLQIARSEAKSITIHTETIDVCGIIQAVIGTLKPLADQKKIKLTHHCPTKQLFVRADPDKLREIFNNLVSNAIKYSETGTISIYHITEQDMVVTHVKDQGFGIAEQDQKKLFTRFYRVEEQVAKGIPGTGLGLFIVKQLVEKMRGRIWFTSKLGSGTTFSFSLPQG